MVQGLSPLEFNFWFSFLFVKLHVSSKAPARIGQLVRVLDLKTSGCGFNSWAGQHNNYHLSFG